MNMGQIPMGIVEKRNKLKLWQENVNFTCNWHAMTFLVYLLLIDSMLVLYFQYKFNPFMFVPMIK